MRLSMQKKDKAYKGGAGVGAIVFLDGEKVKDCLTADEEDGLVIVTKRNEEGHVFLDGDEVATEIKRGKVVIVLPEQWEFLRNQ